MGAIDGDSNDSNSDQESGGMSNSINPSDISCLRITKFPRWELGVKAVAHVPPPERMEWVVIMGIYGTIF